jgi:hypothetical protein
MAEELDPKLDPASGQKKQRGVELGKGRHELERVKRCGMSRGQDGPSATGHPQPLRIWPYRSNTGGAGIPGKEGTAAGRTKQNAREIKPPLPVLLPSRYTNDVYLRYLYLLF